MGKNKFSFYNKKVVIPIVIALLIGSAFGLYRQIEHWIARDAEVEIPVEDVLPTLENASSISFNGDFNNVNANIYVEADGVFVGTIKEEGFVSTTFTYTANDTDLMYIESGGEAVFEETIGMPLAAYNMEGAVLGYAEEMLGTLPDGTGEYATFFFDENAEYKSYMIVNNVEILPIFTKDVINENSETVLSLSYEVDFANGVFEMVATPTTVGEIPVHDILMAFCEVYSMANSDMPNFK